MNKHTRVASREMDMETNKHNTKVASREMDIMETKKDKLRLHATPFTNANQLTARLCPCATDPTYLASIHHPHAKQLPHPPSSSVLLYRIRKYKCSMKSKPA